MEPEHHLATKWRIGIPHRDMRFVASDSIKGIVIAWPRIVKSDVCHMTLSPEEIHQKWI
jgi:hypothetical protein